MGRIKSLPRNAPKHVRDELWITYTTLNSMSTMANAVPLALSVPSAPMTISGLSDKKDPIPLSNETPDT